MTINVYVVPVKTTCRDWGDTSFDIEGVWPTFEKALEFLQQKKDGKCIMILPVGIIVTGMVSTSSE